VTSDGTNPTPLAGTRNGTAGPGTDIAHLVHRRDLAVPDEDRSPLAEYWAHMRQLRAAVDERMLAGSEIAVTWSAAVSPDAG
jgi:hypothetical protein